MNDGTLADVGHYDEFGKQNNSSSSVQTEGEGYSFLDIGRLEDPKKHNFVGVPQHLSIRVSNEDRAYKGYVVGSAQSPAVRVLPTQFNSIFQEILTKLWYPPAYPMPPDDHLVVNDPLLGCAPTVTRVRMLSPGNNLHKSYTNYVNKNVQEVSDHERTPFESDRVIQELAQKHPGAEMEQLVKGIFFWIHCWVDC